MGRLMRVRYNDFVFFCSDCRHCKASSVMRDGYADQYGIYDLMTFECTEPCWRADRLNDQGEDEYGEYIQRRSLMRAFDWDGDDWDNLVEAIDRKEGTTPYDEYEILVSDERRPLRSNYLYRA